MKRIVLLLLLALMACAVPGKSGEIEPTPTVRSAMQATDPAAFVRPAGHPQFVEFFAPW